MIFIDRRILLLSFITTFMTACLITFSLHSQAQTFSYDGNRWYEIEVSIFSNESLPSRETSREAPSVPSRRPAGDELVIPEKTRIGYPEEIRQLASASSNFLIDFEPEPVSRRPSFLFANEEEPVAFGPSEKPVEENFTLTDFNRDPYIALGNEEAEFQRYNRDIANSPDHRLLYHAVWRQPLLNRVQSTAVFVDGGDQRGSHRELEGSLLFSFNGNRVDVEARLWLSRFDSQSFQILPLQTRSLQTGRWQLPERPFPLTEEPSSGNVFNSRGNNAVAELAFMDQVRSMTSNTLHYLDHPDIGMLVEIRPYQLPQPSSFSFE